MSQLGQCDRNFCFNFLLTSYLPYLRKLGNTHLLTIIDTLLAFFIYELIKNYIIMSHFG
jgi:hypothetical protein